MKIHTLTLLAAIVVVGIGSCTKRSIQPQFKGVVTDTLICGSGFTCQIEYRFASIENTQASAALAAIEQTNISRFFELEDFDGTPEEATAATIRQVAGELAPPEDALKTSRPSEWSGQITIESDGFVVDTLLCYAITRSSYLGGAHGIYDVEYYTFSLTSGCEITIADLFTMSQMEHLDALIRQSLYVQYEAQSDEELAEKGFFPEYIRATENFRISREGITFYYNPYEIGCYALGAVEVTISRNALADL